MIEPTYSVTELSQAIGRAVARSFPDEVWVQGEIRDLNRARSGHVYFSLVDPDGEADSGSGDSVLPVTLFASDRDAVNRLLTRSGAIRMTDGIEVRVRGRVGHYGPRSTVQLRMTWIDTEFTVGRLATERDRIMRSLAKDGLLDANAAIPMPLVPFRVGLVTSAGSAAYADFLEELRASAYGWAVVVGDVRVQGVDAERSILQTLRQMAGRELDVVAIVRGGGAQTDLAAFDSEAIARAIARFPYPVVAGIGHEIDTTVVDAVVARSFKTPTACAAGLVGRVDEFAARLERTTAAAARAASRVLATNQGLLTERSRRIETAALTRTAAERGKLRDAHAEILDVAQHGPRRALRRLDTVAAGLSRMSGLRAIEAGRSLDVAQNRLALAARRGTSTASVALASMEARVVAQDPGRLLARGWSVTRTGEGDLVTSVAGLAPDDTLVTTVADGTIDSAVTVLRSRRAHNTIEDR